MQITGILAPMGGLRSMARELGVDKSRAANRAVALIPAILGGFKKQAQAQPTGLDGFGGLLEKLGGGELLDNVLAPQPTDVSQGNSVLGQIFGAVAQPAPSRAGRGGGLGNRLGGLLGEQNDDHATQGAASGLASMRGMNGDGNALDDILRMAGKAMR